MPHGTLPRTRKPRVERLADDIYFADRELGMSLNDFLGYVAYYIKQRHLINRSQEVKAQIEFR